MLFEQRVEKRTNETANNIGTDARESLCVPLLSHYAAVQKQLYNTI